MIRWIDITEESLLDPSERKILFRDTEVTEGDHRLRKVQLWTVQPNTNIIGEAKWAFIVERKQP